MKNQISKYSSISCIVLLTIICTFFSANAQDTDCQHTATHHVVTVSTCGTNGYDRTVCDRCNYVISESVIYANGHSYGEWTVITPATHVSSGLRRRSCTKCSTVENDIIPRLYDAHEFSSKQAVAPNCETEGIVEYTCDLCNYRYSQTIPALGHTFNERTDNADGTSTGACERCNQVFTIDSVTGKPVTDVTDEPQDEPEQEDSNVDRFFDWLENLYVWINDVIKNMKEIIAMI